MVEKYLHVGVDSFDGSISSINSNETCSSGRIWMILLYPEGYGNDVCNSDSDDGTRLLRLLFVLRRQ